LRIFQSKIYSYKIEGAGTASQQLQKAKPRGQTSARERGEGSERELGWDAEEEQAKHTASTQQNRGKAQ